MNAIQSRLPAASSAAAWQVHIFISQDGSHSGVTAVIQDFTRALASARPDMPPVTHLKHQQHPTGGGYVKLARHFGWALGQIFDVHDMSRVIILEDDLEISVDFFQYFAATARVLDADPTVFCVSAWNDHGQGHHVLDSKALYRSDFFPGLGWMTNKRVWADFRGKWAPGGYWDDWLREPPVRYVRPLAGRNPIFFLPGGARKQWCVCYRGGGDADSRLGAPLSFPPAHLHARARW